MPIFNHSYCRYAHLICLIYCSLSQLYFGFAVQNVCKMSFSKPVLLSSKCILGQWSGVWIILLGKI